MNNKVDYNSICDNELKEKTIKEFHRAIVKDLINKYGAKTMKDVMRKVNLQR
ncbi:hypothetical protein [Clostridium beijerinckii]|uniref:hypothetical protein n=1 Tax=Clostridium beijerinckii TaxID=1520 RepID=UPI001494A212|nr:hypothetical protein [Clostridium beijerinckii]NOW04895.1 hypothetical protein [Clostridium beijerinckii]NYC01962.1 hypothetical protein [Clostridium beijerinckii]